MSYRYLESIATADVAFLATGASREELFSAAADALLNVMVDNPAGIRPGAELGISLREEDLELLLFSFLNELIFLKDARQLLLRVSRLAIEMSGEEWSLEARLAGERIDPSHQSLLVDVKAATLHRFRVEETADGWEAEVVLDI